jgi:hypothetical protein
MVTAVHLDEQAGVGHALAAAAMPGGSARTGTTDPRPAQQSLYGFPGHADPLALGEQFGELVIVHAGVAAPREREDPGADIRGEQTRGGSPAIAVGESRRAMPLQAPPESPEVTR